MKAEDYNMRLSISKSKNSTSLYVIKSTYNDGVGSTRVVEKLGTVDELRSKLNGRDPIEWARAYIAELTRQEKETSREVLVKYSPTKVIAKDERRLYNGGYLFLQKIYYELSLDKICAAITAKYKFTFDLCADVHPVRLHRRAARGVWVSYGLSDQHAWPDEKYF